MTTQLQNQVIELKNSGMSIRAIAKELGRSEMAIRTRLQRAEVSADKPEKVRYTSAELTTEQVEALTKMIELKSVIKVANELGLAQMSARTRLLRAATKLGVNTIAEAVDKYIELTTLDDNELDESDS